MRAILIFTILAGISFADVAGVKNSRTEVPTNQLEKLSLFGVKMGDFYDDKNNKLEHKQDSPISSIRVLCDDDKKAHTVYAVFNHTNMTKLNSWLKNFIDVVGRPTEFKLESKEGFTWMKFTEDNVFLTKDLNLISIYCGRDFEFTSENLVEMRWIKKVDNKIHFFVCGDYTASYARLRWEILDESEYPYNDKFEPIDLPKLK